MRYGILRQEEKETEEGKVYPVLIGCGEEVTQREIGNMLGISRSYVSRIEKRALQKLRAGMESPD